MYFDSLLKLSGKLKGTGRSIKIWGGDMGFSYNGNLTEIDFIRTTPEKGNGF